MGDKGSIKNLYKSWRLFLEEKKRKKLKLQNNKSSKIKAFFATFFTFLLSPFFFGNNEKKGSMKQIELLISEIETEKNPEVLIELKQELRKEKKKLEDKKSKILKGNKQVFENNKIKKIIKAEEKIDRKLEILKIRENQEEHKLENNSILKEIVKKDRESLNAIEPVFVFKKGVSDEKKIVEKTKTQLKDPDILEFLNYMKLEINTIEYKLKGDLNLFQLKYLKTRITELNYKRENFKANYDFSRISDLYISKDKYHLLKNNDVLDSLYKKCDTKIVELSKKKEEPKEEKKKANQGMFDLSEIKKINVYLEKEIKKQELMISKLQLELSKTEKKLKKPTLIGHIKKLIKNSINFCLDLVPFTFIKNKLVGGLVSAFMLNNSIRGIRNLVNSEKIEYARLLNNINNQKDLIFNTRLVYEDAITQIEFLKYDLLSKFSFTDLKNIFTKIYEMEEEIKRKNKILSDLEIELEETYVKTREKTKKYVA